MELNDTQRKALHEHLDSMVEELGGTWSWFELELTGMRREIEGEDYSAEHVYRELLTNSEGGLTGESGFREVTHDFRDSKSWRGAS